MSRTRKRTLATTGVAALSALAALTLPLVTGAPPPPPHRATTRHSSST